MALWEYKVITSGPHGFASPALLEAHLNSLAKDEWEIVHFQAQPTNPLAFNGLVRRPSARDWSPPPEPVISAPTKTYEPPVPAGKPVMAGPAKAEETLAARIDEKGDTPPPTREESIRTVRDTERDSDPDAEEEEDDWDEWEESNEDLPTFFEALKPHLRRNQKGVGMSVAVDYLAKRWDQREADLIGALKECGFNVPDTEEIDPEYFEFEGDLYWVNRNNRGQLFVNTREKPRPAFRVTQAKKLDPNDPAAAELVAERSAEKAEIEKRKAERVERAERQAASHAASNAAAAAAAAAKENQGPAISDQDGPDSLPETKSENDGPAAPLPKGQELLDKIRPLMRRNRRGPGYSGSVGFLARALKQSEADLAAALTELGLTAPANAADKPVYVEITDGVYWMNKDSRGGVWINGREKREGGQKNDKGENADQTAPSSDANGTTAETITPTDAAAVADKLAEGAPGAVPVVSAETSSPPTTSADAAVEGSPSAQPSSETSSNVSQPSESSISVSNPTSSSEAVGAPPTEPAPENSGGSSSGEDDSEAGKAAKAAKPRRAPSSRPRTRKPKAETDGSTPATPEGESTSTDESAKES